MNKKLHLTPAQPEDRKKIYDWLCNWNDGSVYDEIPGFSEMCAEEDDFFYNASAPEKGMYLIIKAGDEEVGCISYTCFHLNSGVAEFDVWLKDESVCGKGYGYKAIKTLIKQVHKELRVNTILIRPSRKNNRAINVYKKCGFIKMPFDISEYMKPEFLKEYGPGDLGVEGTENMITHL